MAYDDVVATVFREVLLLITHATAFGDSGTIKWISLNNLLVAALPWILCS
jgi:hypothetical protein